jgi:F-type H+-transporting ATPase subunit alpha
VPDEHVEAMDQEELEKESVQVKKEKPKDTKESKDTKKDKK